ncbi:F-box protein PP2-B10 [Dendrobium catenatum]|uniref:F-box protein PP2-B10 n=2 Tax=Dendrobium catenatum TaxID=906689 RepID=A0A2I0VGT9_9ASPA|nr:F-box protein PP2-B10 [Dendrobium catenatum]
MEEQESSRLGPNFLRRINLLRHVIFAQELLEILRDPLNDQAVEAPNVPDETDEPQDQAHKDRGIVEKPQTRKDGWMEILLGEFYNEEGDNEDVAMSFSEIKGRNYKSDLIVQGIKIRHPKK